MVSIISYETTHSIFLDGGEVEDAGSTCIEVGNEGVTITRGSCGRLGALVMKNTVLFPGMCNMHTHIMDAFMPEKLEDLSLRELVSHPSGAKFRELERVDERHLIGPVMEFIGASLERGVRGIVTYVELASSGWKSVLDRLGREHHMVPKVVPRVQAERKDVEDYRRLLAQGLGVGLDTPFDFPAEELRKLVSEAISKGVGAQVHVSEDPDMHRLRDYEIIRGLRGLEAVHLTHADRESILDLAESGVVPVFCPRSNILLVGRVPPLEVVEELYDRKLAFGWGTDNAAWVPPDIAGEALTAYLVAKGRASSLGKLSRGILWGMLAPCAGFAPSIHVIAHVPLLDNSTDVPRTLVKRLASSTLAALIHGGGALVHNPLIFNAHYNHLAHEGVSFKDFYKLLEVLSAG